MNALAKRAAPEIAVDATPIVEIRNLNFNYGSLTIIENLNLKISQGEFVSIIGPSGCGKSTLLSMIDGVLKPTAGSILIGGRPLEDRAVPRAVVYQNFALMPWKTVYQNVELGLRYRHKQLASSQRRDRIMHYLKLVGMTHVRDHYPHQLSGGMQQRVGLARAFAVEPDLLLMDEPFGALDAQTAEILREELRQLVRTESKTILFITHNLDEALQLSDRVLLMASRPGRIADEVNAEEVPTNDEAAAVVVRDRQRRRLWDHLRNEVLRAAQ